MFKVFHRYRALSLLCVLLSLSGLSVDASASGCNRVVTKKIAFSKGSVCWNYHGDATEFVGRFSQGQVVSVSMSGEAFYMGDNGQIMSMILPRSIVVQGPDNFIAVEDSNAPQGTFELVLPQSGAYTISFSPCSMWGGVGDVMICAE